MRLLAPWRWRSVWKGLFVAAVSLAVGVQGMVMSARERSEQIALEGMREGLGLLAIERDVSLAAHDAIASLLMDMHSGGLEAETARRFETLRSAVGRASVALGERPPSEGWRPIHEGMQEAAEDLLASFDEPRGPHQSLAWLDEFLYDFKRVVPTDNAGRWTPLLEVTTWAQEASLVFRDYLAGAMAREWSLAGRPPAAPSLIDEYQATLNAARRLRESHGEAARAFSFFEEYILPERASEADSTAMRIVARLAAHPGVRQMEEDTPYLLSLTDERSFASIEELAGDRDVWATELAGVADELLVHADARLGGALAASRRRDLAGRGAAGAALLAALLFSAVMVRRRIRVDSQLKMALKRDALTGLANRFALFSTAPEILSDPERASYALIHLDLDDFKSINDEHGHHIGDRALIEFATALSAAVRSTTDLVCRIGGDEFVLLLHGLGDARREVERVVERLRERLEQPLRLEGTLMHLHFTAGVAVSDEPAALEDLLVEADLALIEAKEKGRDVAHFFRRRLGRRMVEELSTALGSGELRCVFQPQLDLATGAVVGFEALARWQREDRMRIPTRNLIDALEWLGAGQDWLRVAMRDIAAAWGVTRRHFEGRLWLNLMASDIEASDPGTLLSILSEPGVPLDRLGVEIADPVGRAEKAAATALLGELRSAGVRVALDDVGDDRVPLLHMAELPVDRVKLDRCVVRGIDAQPALRAVAGSLTDLSRRLDLEVLAEGVETPAEEAVVRELGIRYVQGFLYARPLPVSALRGFLEREAVKAAAGAA